jgi:hypothetical protein
MPSYVITVSNDEMIALNWKFIDPAKSLNELAKKRCEEACDEIAILERKTALLDSGFSGTLPKTNAALVQEMISQGRLKSAKQNIEEGTAKMLRMMANPDDVD